MMFTSQSVFQLAWVLYSLALLMSLGTGKRRVFTLFFLASGVAANLVVVLFRYHQAWPMLPMHLGAIALPLCLGFLAPFVAGSSLPRGQVVERILLALIVLLAGTALCFPKDFYLPFLKSKTLLSHSFLWFGLVGKGCFAVSATWALTALPLCWSTSCGQRLTDTMHHCHRWAALGFALWTVSMFSGELWSYLGWGTPVVWEDPALTLTMAAWFFYACYLHLHLTRSWNPAARALYASLGGLAIIALTCVPDFGPFRVPF